MGTYTKINLMFLTSGYTLWLGGITGSVYPRSPLGAPLGRECELQVGIDEPVSKTYSACFLSRIKSD